MRNGATFRFIKETWLQQKSIKCAYSHQPFPHFSNNNKGPGFVVIVSMLISMFGINFVLVLAIQSLLVIAISPVFMLLRLLLLFPLSYPPQKNPNYP